MPAETGGGGDVCVGVAVLPLGLTEVSGNFMFGELQNFDLRG